MAKLYPPMIESKLPAQYGDKLRVPFQHSRAVGPSQYSGLRLLITSATTGEEKGFVTILRGDSIITSPATFNIASINTLTPGEYYKAQLAYTAIVNGIEEAQTYSTPGVFKYTTQPQINGPTIATDNKTVRVSFSTSDRTEWLESYSFDIHNSSGKIGDSGTQLCKPYVNQPVEVTYTCDVPLGLYDEGSARVYYSLTTNNGLVHTSYYDVQLVTYSDAGDIGLVDVDSDNGAIQLAVQAGSGAFYRKNLLNNEILKVHSIDYTLEQGVEYEYMWLPDNSSNYSNTTVILDFEDMFLADETRQLRIRFNPKVSSFKETVQESKLNAIGSKFPISYRNGSVQYKEFPISGLISYEMDNDQLFMQDKSRPNTKQVRTSTEADAADAIEPITAAQRIAAERRFKLEVLQWLNNGQPKLFRSPTEGNYIVRLTNVSLSPNDQLGRMLHTFNATAYEIADYNSANLNKHKVIFKGAPQ